MEKDNSTIKEQLMDHEKRIRILEEILTDKNTPIIKQLSDKNTKLAKVSGLDVNLIKNLIQFDDTDFSLLFNVKGENHKEKQINASLILLSIYNYCYDKNFIRSNDLKNKLKYFGIGSLQNIAKNFKTKKNYFIPEGKPSTKNYGYIITYPGLEKGIQLLNEIATAE